MEAKNRHPCLSSPFISSLVWSSLTFPLHPSLPQFTSSITHSPLYTIQQQLPCLLSLCFVLHRYWYWHWHLYWSPSTLLPQQLQLQLQTKAQPCHSYNNITFLTIHTHTTCTCDRPDLLFVFITNPSSDSRAQRQYSRVHIRYQSSLAPALATFILRASTYPDLLKTARVTL